MPLSYPEELWGPDNLFSLDERLDPDVPPQSEEQARLLRNCSPGTRISTLHRSCVPQILWPLCSTRLPSKGE